MTELASAADPHSPGESFHQRFGRDDASPIRIGGRKAFWQVKRVGDVMVASVGLSFVVALALLLLAANPRFNPGPVFFVQKRMGRDGKPFMAIKFRTMRPLAVDAGRRGAEDPVELDRITPLGAWLRATRLDETPQFVNVLMGEMSLVGPRPDIYEHAEVFVRTVPGYRSRYAVRPGISGLAQVRMGYAEGALMTRRKTRKDLVYIRRANWRVELAILLKTFWVVRTGFGAR